LKAYNSNILFNTSVKRKAENWLAQKLITEEQFISISNYYNTYSYTPNIFVRIGLFIFTCFIVLASLGMYFLLFSSGFNTGSGFYEITSLLYAIACFTALELLIRKKQVYKAGSDDALLYVGLISISLFIFSLMSSFETDSPIVFFSSLLPILFAACVRYADRLVTFAVTVCMYAIVFLIVQNLCGTFAKLIMPFAFMAFSAFLFFQLHYLHRKERMHYWHSCLALAKFVALLILYASGNYYIIRESGEEFFDLHLLPGQDIPLAVFFYVFTAVVPFIYVYLGLKNKDKILLWAGLLVFAAGAITFKYYFSMGHPEITLTLGGALLILIAYFSIQYFKKPRHGISFEEEQDADSFLKTNAEALIIMEGLKQESPAIQNDFKFGGGQSGGAGSGGSF
jgi:hypothetical protein